MMGFIGISLACGQNGLKVEAVYYTGFSSFFDFSGEGLGGSSVSFSLKHK